MAIIPQRTLYSWTDVEAKSDLDRLRLVLETLPDEELMQDLEAERRRRRNEYPLRAVWNSILAGVVFQHPSIASLRRELSRNGELRWVCGFDPTLGDKAVPPPPVYTRFLYKLLKRQEQVQGMFEQLVDRLTELLPNFGERLAVDGKPLPSFGRRRNESETADGRSERDADTGVKTYRGVSKDGRPWERVKSWFGFQVVTIIDSESELPVAFHVTSASCSETKELLPLMEELSVKHPQLVSRAKVLTGDKGFDSAEIHQRLWQSYGVKGVIDTREMWKEDKLRALYDDGGGDVIVYSERGDVLCRWRDDGAREEENYRRLQFRGFEADRDSLKYQCPLAGAQARLCPTHEWCERGCRGTQGRIVRIPLSKDRRIFTPIARSSGKWRREYKQRSAVERYHSRLDVSFGFEKHTIRGLRKMSLQMSVALVVMLSLAVGHIEAEERELMRSLVRRAA